MTRAADRLRHRILVALQDCENADIAERVRLWLQENYLPGALLGMKGAARHLGLFDPDGNPSSNALSMRLKRGHPLQFVAEIDGNRITTRDLVEEYAEILPSWQPGSHDVSQEAS